jgi:uncharacterized protein (TIGR03083 family)
MEPDIHIAHLRTEAAALLAAAAAAPHAAVPACPEWDRAGLLSHTGVVHSWVRLQLATGPEERTTFRDAPRPPEGDDLFGWFEENATALADGLEAMDTTVVWPSWAGPQPAAWFPRRMAQETAVHRWDADPSPIDADLAVDGIDEMLQVFVPRFSGEQVAAIAGSIHLHATDDGPVEPGDWLVTMGPEGITHTKGPRTGDAALHGTASDLLLWIWNRVPVDERFEVTGDAALVRGWADVVRI